MKVKDDAIPTNSTNTMTGQIVGREYLLAFGAADFGLFGLFTGFPIAGPAGKYAQLQKGHWIGTPGAAIDCGGAPQNGHFVLIESAMSDANVGAPHGQCSWARGRTDAATYSLHAAIKSGPP